MKKVLLVMLITVISISTYAQNKKEFIEVYYFHRTNRCATCNAIEKVVKETLDTEYAKEFKSGDITFNSVDYQSETENAYVKELSVENPTLVIVYHKKKKQTVIDLTDDAFEYAYSEPEKLKKSLMNKINECFR